MIYKIHVSYNVQGTFEMSELTCDNKIHTKFVSRRAPIECRNQQIFTGLM